MVARCSLRIFAHQVGAVSYHGGFPSGAAARASIPRKRGGHEARRRRHGLDWKCPRENQHASCSGDLILLLQKADRDPRHCGHDDEYHDQRRHIGPDSAERLVAGHLTDEASLVEADTEGR
jgi:hypothetical protein